MDDGIMSSTYIAPSEPTIFLSFHVGNDKNIANALKSSVFKSIPNEMYIITWINCNRCQHR